MTNFLSKAPTLPGVMRRGDKVKFRGKLMRFIGSGTFAAAYRMRGKQVRLITYFGDESKWLLVLAQNNKDEQGQVIRHIPVMRCEGHYEERDRPISVYDTEFYRHPFLSEDYHHQSDYQQGVKGTRIELDIHRLKQAHKEALKQYPEIFTRSSQVTAFNTLFIHRCDQLRVNITIIEALERLHELAQMGSTSYAFDKPRPNNLGIDKNGELILIDPMFDYFLFTKIRRELCKRTKVIQLPARVKND